MPSLERINAAITAVSDSAGAEPAPDASADAPPTGDDSGVGSAPADEGGASLDANTGGEENVTSPGAIDEARAATHAALAHKLEAERARTRAKLDRRRAREETTKAAEERKAAAEERAKWEKIGKEGSYLDGLKALGRDPRTEFERMQQEAIEAGTPKARLAELERTFASKIDETVGPLKTEIEQLKAERDAARAEADHRGVISDFTSNVVDQRYASLREEYDDPTLFEIARGLKSDPERLESHAKKLGVDLTEPEGGYTMGVILEVLKATQDEHHRRIQQRRAKNEAPSQSSTAAPTQAPEAARPRVNGAVERAGNTIGNDLATSRATESDRLRGMSRADRVAYLAKKYG